MKKYIKLLMFLFPLIFSLQSCYEDKGNYTYDWVEEVVITNLKDTVIGWGDTLSLKPNLQKTVFSQNSDTININPEDYSYEWYTHNDKNQKVILSTKQYINDTIYIPVRNDNYLVNYEITEKATGITWNARFNLKVINRFQSAFFFLTEDEDKNVELEIFGKDAEGVEHLVKRLLSAADFPFRSGGANSVFYFNHASNRGARIWIATGEGTGWLSGTDFTWDEKNVANLKMVEYKPTSYTFKHIQSFSSNFIFFVTEQGEAHLFHVSGDVFYPDFAYLSDGSKISFYPFLGGTIYGLMGYDRNSKEFISYDLFDAQAKAPANYCFKMNSNLAAAQGMELIHMQYVNSLSRVHAYIKNPLTNTYYRYSYQINRNEASQYGGVLVESEIATLGDLSLMEQAEYIIIERKNGYIYFSIGNKLYNYRIGSGIDACVELPYEFDEITCLTEDNISHEGSSYNVIGIATYSEANGGKVYYMQPQDTESRRLNLIKTYEGLGKVKSISRW